MFDHTRFSLFLFLLSLFFLINASMQSAALNSSSLFLSIASVTHCWPIAALPRALSSSFHPHIGYGLEKWFGKKLRVMYELKRKKYPVHSWLIETAHTSSRIKNCFKSGKFLKNAHLCGPNLPRLSLRSLHSILLSLTIVLSLATSFSPFLSVFPSFPLPFSLLPLSLTLTLFPITKYHWAAYLNQRNNYTLTDFRLYFSHYASVKIEEKRNKRTVMSERYKHRTKSG